MKPEQPDSTTRRGFLKNAASVGAGAAVTALLPHEVLASQTRQTSDPVVKKGYEVTQHVVDYYKSAAL